MGRKPKAGTSGCDHGEWQHFSNLKTLKSGDSPIIYPLQTISEWIHGGCPSLGSTRIWPDYKSTTLYPAPYHEPWSSLPSKAAWSRLSSDSISASSTLPVVLRGFWFEKMCFLVTWWHEMWLQSLVFQQIYHTVSSNLRYSTPGRRVVLELNAFKLPTNLTRSPTSFLHYGIRDTPTAFPGQHCSNLLLRLHYLRARYAVQTDQSFSSCFITTDKVSGSTGEMHVLASGQMIITHQNKKYNLLMIMEAVPMISCKSIWRLPMFWAPNLILICGLQVAYAWFHLVK